MERKSLLKKYVRAALYRLHFEKAVYKVQTGIFAASLFAVLILVISRLFVFPYYGRSAFIGAVLVLLATIVSIVYKRSGKAEAVRQLDSFMPDNLLITAMDVEVSETHLAPAIISTAESNVINAFERFKKREKRYVNPKMLSGFLIVSACLALLVTFPSEAQLEAGAIEKEKEIIEEIKKEVQDLIEKEELPKVKNELQELAEKLLKAETSEEMLKELVKKQKELRLKEQRLADKKEIAKKSGDVADSLSDAEEKELGELGKLSDILAENAGKAQSALNKIGKAPALSGMASSENNSSAPPSDMKPGTTEENDEDNSDDEGENQGQGQSDEQGEGQGQSQGQDQGEGQDQSEGQGQGKDQGEGQGQGQGQGQGGAGAGQGSGGRNLLSIPNDRVGKKSEPSIVSGELGDGNFIEERETEGPVEKGTIRPYKEVIGNYKDSYLKSTDKMKLPPDLQHILSDYFSSIE